MPDRLPSLTPQKRAPGFADYQALAVEIDKVEKLRLLAADVGGTGERVYVLRTFDEDAAPAALKQTLNRLGGVAPGVAAKRWPTFADEPMVHLFTLDVQTMPELAARVDDGVRCVSVFCWNPENNEANESGNAHTAVLFTTEAQLAQKRVKPPVRTELQDLAFFEPVGIDVSPTVWDVDSPLRRALSASSGRVLGEPLWLQGDDEGGGSTFLMQFDESFCSMNLGDAGIMYVFDDDAFWQSH